MEVGKISQNRKVVGAHLVEVRSKREFSQEIEDGEVWMPSASSESIGGKSAGTALESSTGIRDSSQVQWPQAEPVGGQPQGEWPRQGRKRDPYQGSTS